MTAIIIGALLLVAGIVYMAGATLKRGRLSDPAPVDTAPGRMIPATTGPTLEPERRGLRFLGLTTNWPGLLMLVVGAALLLSAMI